MDSTIFQYFIIAAIVLFAGYFLVKLIIKNVSPKRFKKGKPGCDSDCGCS